MANKKKEEIKIKVDNASNENLKADEQASASFVDSIIETFQDKGALLEAERLVNASNKSAEADLINHDEEHSRSFKIHKSMHAE